MFVTRSCQACSVAARTVPRLTVRRAFSSSRLLLSDSIPPTSASSASSSSPPEAPKQGSKPHKSIDVSHLQVKLNEARHTAHLKLKTLLATLDTNTKKQRKALSAAIEAWELERKLRHVGGKINEATGYEEIERLRVSVGDKGSFSSSTSRVSVDSRD